MPVGYGRGNNRIADRAASVVNVQPSDPTELLQQIAQNIKAIRESYVIPNTNIRRSGVLRPYGTPFTGDGSISDIFDSGTTGIDYIIVQAMAGTIELVFGPSGDRSILANFTFSDTNPIPTVIPWNGQPVQLWIRNQDGTGVDATYGVLVVGG